jgi:5-methylcytosine-specific restriction endonuclease McrA
MNVISQPVLCLNNLWQALNTKTVKEALISMLGGVDGNNPPALAIDMNFRVDENGSVDWDNPEYVQPVDWETWKNLPIRDYDLAIHTSNMTIRAPRVIIQPNYSKMPVVTPRPTKESIRKRDGGVCQYTGRQISWKDGNIDHVIPRTKGGKNTFENMVWCHKEINSKKGDKTPEQAGLKLIRKPKAPRAVPVSSTIQIAHHPSWIHFLDNVTEVRQEIAS